ncbi:MAG: GNAT family N-acetyltransferase [Myxococcota bacterium]
MTAACLRPYAGASDLAAMKALVRDLWRERGAQVECMASDLDWRAGLYLDDPSHDPELVLCEDGARLVGFGWRTKGALVDLVVRTDADLAARALVAWGVDHPSPVSVYALAGNATLERALAAAGLAPGGEDYLTFERPPAPVAAHAPAPPWPDGYRAAPMSEVGDVAARAALHRAAFGSPRMTEARYRRLTESPGYDAALDMVALDASGALAAFVLGWLDAELGVGELEPVGTHPDHRRKGLARRLVMETLARLAARGAHAAYIGAVASDPVTPALYASLGFTVIGSNVAYRRPA